MTPSIRRLCLQSCEFSTKHVCSSIQISQNKFSLSVNERFGLEGGFVGIIEWILRRRNQKWNGILTREVLENARSYKEAQNMLALPKLLAPTYFILTGSKPSQVSIRTAIVKPTCELGFLDEVRYFVPGLRYH